MEHKIYIISDWFNGAEKKSGTSLKQAVCDFLNEDLDKIERNEWNKHEASAFGCRLTKEIERKVFSSESKADQSEILADLPETFFFSRKK